MYILAVEKNVKELIKNAPRVPGVYLFLDKEGRVIYVGKAKNLAARLSSYRLPEQSLLPKTARMVRGASSLRTMQTSSELEALLLEAKLIRKNQPKFNSQSKDDKQPLYIKITSEEFPKVLTARRVEVSDKRSSYFGPFPSSKTVRSVLKMLRRIFPFCSQDRIGKRRCFYSHIGLCNPCPAEIVKHTGAEREVLTKEYRKNVFRIKRVLEGRSNMIIREMEREMSGLADREAFEEAAIVKKRVEDLRYIIQRPVLPDDFLANPNLAAERAREGAELFWSLIGSYFPGCVRPTVVEGYDISNISGRQAVGSQVTFVEGLPDKKRYKRYRVRMVSRPNDVGMMREVLSRRFRHREWEMPGLVLVDGGKPQVAAALDVLRDERLVIPVVGLAKRNEEVIVPTSNGGFEQLMIRKSAGALYFVQHIRDEAHRFAQNYHHVLMSRRLKAIDAS